MKNLGDAFLAITYVTEQTQIDLLRLIHSEILQMKNTGTRHNTPFLQKILTKIVFDALLKQYHKVIEIK